MASRAAISEEVQAVPFRTIHKTLAWRPWAFLTGKALVPRVAVLLLASAFVAASVGLAVVHAQSRPQPLWFQFELHPFISHSSINRGGRQDVAQAGYDQGSITWTSPTEIVGIHVAVFAITGNRVEIGIRARRISPNDAHHFNSKEIL